MFKYIANNNVSLYSVNYFNDRGFYQILFTTLRSKWGFHERRLEICRRVSPAEDYVGIDSKEYFLKLILPVKEVFLEIPVSLAAVISNDLFVHFSRYYRSWKCLLNEHAFIWKNDMGFFYHFINIKISRIYNIFWANIFLRKRY